MSNDVGDAATQAGCTIVVPTIDSARWIASVHAYYRDLGVAPLFIVDSRSDDATRRVLTKIRADHVVLRNTAPRVEGFVGKFRDVVGTDWILRFDDDECPSPALLCWLARQRRADGDAIGFVRRWLRFTPAGDLEWCASRSWDWRWRHMTSERGEDRQFRLWHRNRVEYVTTIHSPGFDYAGGEYAPPECVIYHLAWILRGPAARAAKLDAYEAQRAGAGAEYAKCYLPEQVNAWDDRGIVSDERVRSLALALAASES